MISDNMYIKHYRCIASDIVTDGATIKLKNEFYNKALKNGDEVYVFAGGSIGDVYIYDEQNKTLVLQ